jgi:sulfur carrier protein
MITVTVNGKPREIEAEGDIASFLRSLGVDPRTVAVARNGEVVHREEYPAVTVRAGDVLEVVRMVGGG